MARSDVTLSFMVDTMYIMLNNKYSIYGLLADFPVLQSSVLAPRRCPAQKA